MLAHQDGLTRFKVSACAAAKKLPPPGWTKLDQDVTSVFSPTTRQLKPGALPGAWKPPREVSSNIAEDLGATHSIGNPIQVYPLFENALRAHLSQSIQENHADSVAMYKQFADVAEKNPYAWTYGQHFEEGDIGTVGKRNRMICFPCEYSARRACSNMTDLCRPALDECVQHDQPSWRGDPNVHRICERDRDTRVEMDLRPWRSWHS